MEIQSYKKRLQAVRDLLRNEKVLVENIMLAAGRILYAEFVNRIFVLGKAANGSDIGQYSTKPAYFSPKQKGQAGVPKPRIGLPKSRVVRGKRQPSLKPVGKTGRTVFDNGKPHKTAYLKAGYSEFRKAYGRQNKTVDLNLTGSLFLAVQIGLTRSGIVLFFASKSELNKANGAEKRFGKIIFAINQFERDIFDKEVRRIIQLIVRRIMDGK